MDPLLRNTIESFLKDHLPASTPLQCEPVNGVSINNCFRVHSKVSAFFCKSNSAVKFPQLFQKEAAGLEALSQIIRTPKVIGCFTTATHQILILEWIRPGTRTEGFWKRFGEQLAMLHAQNAPGFGWHESNYMGSVPQQNNASSSWISFLNEQRIAPLVQRCFEKQLLSSDDLKKFDRLTRHLETVFNATDPASLLHGDLWSGNFCCTEDEEPVLIDPAVYYGHASMDLAMTTLFGGFEKSFYEAYHYHNPFPSNYLDQWTACNIYPLLIHLYLFGRSYHSQLMQHVSKFT